MTGITARVPRGGKWVSIEITQLTNEELDKLAIRQSKQGWEWAIKLVKWIRDNVEEVDNGS